MKILQIILIAILAIMLALMVAWYLKVFQGVKYPKVEPANLAPSYEFPLDSKG